MGNTLTVVTSLFAFVQVATGGCIGPSDFKNAECDDDTRLQDDCLKHVTSTGHHCRWQTAEGKIITYKSHSTLKTLMHSEIPHSARIVRKSKGRLTKDLVAIEAITEWVGDVVYYRVLSSFMPEQYSIALGHTKAERIPYADFKIATSTYTCPTSVMPDGTRSVVPTELTLKEENSEENPIQTLLQYSRPFYHTQSYIQAYNMDTFTVGNVVTIAVIVWMDALFMNDDRFTLVPDQSHVNTGNMMLSKYDDKNGATRYEYIPIDQGFARKVYIDWYKKIDKLSTISSEVEDTWPDNVEQQYVYSEGGLSLRDSASIKIWLQWYKTFLKDSQTTDMEYWFRHFFLDVNNLYFPVWDMGSDVEAKIVRIMNTVWKAKGEELIKMCQEEVKNALTQINSHEKEPHVFALLGAKEKESLAIKAKKIFRSKSKSKKPHKSKSKKPHKSKSKKSGIMSAFSKTPPSILDKTKKQWKKVQDMLKKMFNIASKFKQDDSDAFYDKMIFGHYDVLVNDWSPSTGSSAASAAGSAHIGYYDIYNYDGYDKKHKLGETPSVARLGSMKYRIGNQLIHKKQKVKGDSRKKYDALESYYNFNGGYDIYDDNDEYHGYDEYDEGYYKHRNNYLL